VIPVAGHCITKVVEDTARVAHQRDDDFQGFEASGEPMTVLGAGAVVWGAQVGGVVRPAGADSHRRRTTLTSASGHMLTETRAGIVTKNEYDGRATWFADHRLHRRGVTGRNIVTDYILTRTISSERAHPRGWDREQWSMHMISTASCVQTDSKCNTTTTQRMMMHDQLSPD